MQQQDKQQPTSNPMGQMPSRPVEPMQPTQPTQPVTPPSMEKPVGPTPKKMFNVKLGKNHIVVGVAVAVILVTGVLILVNARSGNFFTMFSLMSKDAAAKKAIDYLNQNVLQPGQTATLGTVSEESGVVKIQIKIDGNSYESYITKDGRLLFPQAYVLGKADTSSGNNQGGGGADASKVDSTNEPFIGQANTKAVMVYWFDYQCPFCKKNNDEVVKQLIKDYVDTGKLKIVFKDYAFLGSDSVTAALAEHAVWEIAPTKFYKWHEAMMGKQDAENGGWGNKADVLALTASLGIDSTKVGQLMIQKADEYQKEMDADKAEGTQLGVNGTPGAIVGTKLVSGAQPYATFKAAVDEALTGK